MAALKIRAGWLGKHGFCFTWLKKKHGLHARAAVIEFQKCVGSHVVSPSDLLQKNKRQATMNIKI